MWLVLAVTGMAGASTGLCLSAVVGHRREVAAFVLPLVVLMQMVCSLQVAVGGDKSLVAYEQSFTLKYPSALKQNPEDQDSGSQPQCAVVFASYSTISRYSDIALRSFGYWEDDHEKFGSVNEPEGLSARWWCCRAIATLVLMKVVMVGLGILVLKLQPRVVAIQR